MKITAAYDNDPKCVDTYNRNLDPVARLADLENWEQLSIPECDGIIASPPCQDASIAKAYRGNTTDTGKSSLYVMTAQIVVDKQPSWALIENVPNMKNMPEFGQACQMLTSCGYWITLHKMNHADYGGLTTRERLFLIASKQMLSIPHPTRQTHRSHGPALEPFFSARESDGWGGWNLEKARIKEYDGDATFSQHWGKWRTYRRWAEPFFTLVCGHSSGDRSRWKGQVWQHNDQERAHLQGFPSWYTGLNHQMIGNAIPPELTRPWGQILRRAYGPDQSVVSLFCGAGGGDYGLLEGAA